MKIAIHKREGSFSDRWIAYCEDNGIPYKVVDAYESNIIEQVADCDAIMWHHRHHIYWERIFAKELLFSLQISGKKIFPDFNTCWHYDDKVGQKYLLESIEAPMVNSHVFYEKHRAIDWIDKYSKFPLVFKLRGGAASINVKLVKNKTEAIRSINTAFSKGFKSHDTTNRMVENWNKFKNEKSWTLLRETIAGVKNHILPTNKQKLNLWTEKAYVYFQEFMPGNEYDIRIIVIGDKAFAIKRYVRKNDFRASGSGIITYDKSAIDIRCVEIAFETNEKIRTQCIAYDFVFDQDNNPLIVEISYAFVAKVYDSCPGYWDKNLTWHKGSFIPQYWMIENLISSE